MKLSFYLPSLQKPEQGNSHLFARSYQKEKLFCKGTKIMKINTCNKGKKWNKYSFCSKRSNHFPFILPELMTIPIFSVSSPTFLSQHNTNTIRIDLYTIWTLSIKFRNSKRKLYCYLVNFCKTKFEFRQKELYLYSRKAEGRKHWRLYCLFSYAKGKNCR